MSQTRFEALLVSPEVYHQYKEDFDGINDAGNGYRFEKLGNSSLCSFRIGGKGRIVYTVANISDQRTMVVLGVLEHHEYQKQFLLKCQEKFPSLLKDIEHQKWADYDPDKAAAISNKLFGNQFIAPDNQQQNIINLAPNEAQIIVGPAGSGKTFILCQAMDVQDAGKLAYLTQSPYLLHAMKSEFNHTSQASDEIHTPSRVNVKSFGLSTLPDLQFLSYEQFVLSFLPADFTPISKSDIISWITDKVPLKTTPQKSQDKKKPSTPGIDLSVYGQNKIIALIYQEWTYIASLNEPDEYLKKGERQTLFKKEHRSHVLEWYKKYQSSLKPTEIVIDFYKLPSDKTKKFKKLFIDEAQNLPPLAYHNIPCKAESVSFCIDPNQCSEFSLAKVQQLKDALFQLGIKPVFHELNACFRSSQPIIDTANRLLTIKQAITGGLSSQEEPSLMQLPTEISGEGKVYQFDSATDINSLLDTLKGDANTAVLVPNNLVKTAFLSQYPDFLVLTFEESRGLEFKRVVIYSAFEDTDIVSALRAYKANAAQASKKNRAKNDEKRDLRPALNALFIALTRAKNDLYFLHPQKIINALIPVVNELLQHSQVQIPDMTITQNPEDFKQMALKLWRAGLEHEAKDILRTKLKFSPLEITTFKQEFNLFEKTPTLSSVKPIPFGLNSRGLIALSKQPMDVIHATLFRNEHPNFCTIIKQKLLAELLNRRPDLKNNIPSDFLFAENTLLTFIENPEYLLLMYDIIYLAIKNDPRANDSISNARPYIDNILTRLLTLGEFSFCHLLAQNPVVKAKLLCLIQNPPIQGHLIKDLTKALIPISQNHAPLVTLITELSHQTPAQIPPSMLNFENDFTVTDFLNPLSSYVHTNSDLLIDTIKALRFEPKERNIAHRGIILFARFYAESLKTYNPSSGMPFMEFYSSATNEAYIIIGRNRCIPKNYIDLHQENAFLIYDVNTNQYLTPQVFVKQVKIFNPDLYALDFSLSDDNEFPTLDNLNSYIQTMYFILNSLLGPKDAYAMKNLPKCSIYDSIDIPPPNPVALIATYISEPEKFVSHFNQYHDNMAWTMFLALHIDTTIEAENGQKLTFFNFLQTNTTGQMWIHEHVDIVLGAARRYIADAIYSNVPYAFNKSLLLSRIFSTDQNTAMNGYSGLKCFISDYSRDEYIRIMFTPNNMGTPKTLAEYILSSPSRAVISQFIKDLREKTKGLSMIPNEWLFNQHNFSSICKFENTDELPFQQFSQAKKQALALWLFNGENRELCVKIMNHQGCRLPILEVNKNISQACFFHEYFNLLQESTLSDVTKRIMINDIINNKKLQQSLPDNLLSDVPRLKGVLRLPHEVNNLGFYLPDSIISNCGDWLFETERDEDVIPQILQSYLGRLLLIRILITKKDTENAIPNYFIEYIKNIIYKNNHITSNDTGIKGTTLDIPSVKTLFLILFTHFKQFRETFSPENDSFLSWLKAINNSGGEAGKGLAQYALKNGWLRPAKPKITEDEVKKAFELAKQKKKTLTCGSYNAQYECQQLLTRFLEAKHLIIRPIINKYFEDLIAYFKIIPSSINYNNPEPIQKSTIDCQLAYLILSIKYFNERSTTHIEQILYKLEGYDYRQYLIFNREPQSSYKESLSLPWGRDCIVVDVVNNNSLTNIGNVWVELQKSQTTNLSQTSFFVLMQKTFNEIDTTNTLTLDEKERLKGEINMRTYHLIITTIKNLLTPEAMASLNLEAELGSGSSLKMG